MLKKILAHKILKVWLVIESLGLALMILVHIFWERYATLGAFTFMVFINVLILFFSRPHIYQLFEKTPIEGKDAWNLVQTAQKFARLAGINAPEIYLLKLKPSLSYSFSNSSHSSAIFLSETLVEDLSDEELEALLAYEVARIALGLSFRSVIASSIGYVLNLFAEFLDKIILLQIFVKPTKQKHYAENILAPLVMIMSFPLLGKSQNFAADALACEWLGDKKTLAQTLWKLNSLVTTRPYRIRLSDSYLFSINPLTNQRWTRYFLLQASAKRRILNLVGHYPV